MTERDQRRKEAIQDAISDGAIPTDTPLHTTYIDWYCPECARCTRGLSQVAQWSHLPETETRPQKIECWECGNREMQLKVWSSEWDASLDRLPPSAIPEGYFDG